MIKCHKIVKISDKGISFITKAIKNWKVKLAERKQTIAGVKNPKRYLPVRLARSVREIMSRNTILRKYAGGERFTKQQ